MVKQREVEPIREDVDAMVRKERNRSERNMA